MRSGVGHDEGLANDMGALQVRKAGLELTPGDELLRQGDLLLESRVADSGIAPSGLSDDGDGKLHARNADRQLCALARGRIRRKPFHPFLIHAGEVFFLE